MPATPLWNSRPNTQRGRSIQETSPWQSGVAVGALPQQSIGGCRAGRVGVGAEVPTARVRVGPPAPRRGRLGGLPPPERVGAELARTAPGDGVGPRGQLHDRFGRVVVVRRRPAGSGRRRRGHGQLPVGPARLVPSGTLRRRRMGRSGEPRPSRSEARARLGAAQHRSVRRRCGTGHVVRGERRRDERRGPPCGRSPRRSGRGRSSGPAGRRP